MRETISRLHDVGYDGSLLEPNDLLAALTPEDKLALNDSGHPEIRICNFELISRLSDSDDDGPSGQDEVQSRASVG